MKIGHCYIVVHLRVTHFKYNNVTCSISVHPFWTDFAIGWFHTSLIGTTSHWPQGEAPRRRGSAYLNSLFSYLKNTCLGRVLKALLQGWYSTWNTSAPLGSTPPLPYSSRMWVSVPVPLTPKNMHWIALYTRFYSLCLLNSWSHYDLTAMVTSCQSLLYSLTESGKCVKGLLIWTSHLKFRVSDVWTEISHEHKPRWRDLLMYMRSIVVRFHSIFNLQKVISVIVYWPNDMLDFFCTWFEDFRKFCSR